MVGILFVNACTSNSGATGYAGYNSQQEDQQQYVGGGCGVAPLVPYEEAPVNEILNSKGLAV